MKPAVYWRSNKLWKKWLGKRGKVIASTQINSSTPDLREQVPYCLVLVDFVDERKTMIGTGHDVINTGDDIVCVLRKSASNSNSGLIPYVIKAKKI